MAFFADPKTDFTTWDYITGDKYKGMSIALDRWEYLYDLYYKQDQGLKVALRDPTSGAWTKWKGFSGELFWTDGPNRVLAAPIDVHRSVLPNEIVVESDYPTYEENYEANSIIGSVLEKKGLSPMYYYSGNKSLHTHLLLDWSCFQSVDQIIQEQLRLKFKGSVDRFRTTFMEWFRAKIISCWDTEARQFDKDLIRATHLIRCELSRNKLGYKTFLGYSHKDTSFIPYVCNETNRVYPKLGEPRLSRPKKPQMLIDEFLEHLKLKDKTYKLAKRNRSITSFMAPQSETLRGCVKFILSDDFKLLGEGKARAMFILVNELKRILGEGPAKAIVNEWNVGLGSPIKQEDIDYRFKQKNYNLSCKYIHSLLTELGVKIEAKCKGKIY